MWTYLHVHYQINAIVIGQHIWWGWLPTASSKETEQ